MTKVSKNPLISVIIPVYKAEKYLDKCVESIVNQTYKNLEIILVDDGSPDNCPKMCDDWSKRDKRIKVIHKENSGVSSARNIGIDNSNGSFISFVDADDYVEEEYIELMYEVMIKKNSNYVCCGYKKIYSSRIEEINYNGEIKGYSSKEYIKALLNVQNGYGFVHMKLINRASIGDIRFNENLLVGEDALFNIQLCNKIDKAIIYNNPLYNYRINQNSVVRKYDSNYVKKYTASMVEMKNYINKNFDSKIIQQNLFNYIAYHLMLICVNYCYHPENKNKFNSLKEVCNMEIYKVAIKKSNYDDLSFTRKVTLFTIKYKLYFLTSLICGIRQRQIRE